MPVLYGIIRYIMPVSLVKHPHTVYSGEPPVRIWDPGSQNPFRPKGSRVSKGHCSKAKIFRRYRFLTFSEPED